MWKFDASKGGGVLGMAILKVQTVVTLVQQCSFVFELVLSRFSSGLFRAIFAMKEIENGKEIHR